MAAHLSGVTRVIALGDAVVHGYSAAEFRAALVLLVAPVAASQFSPRSDFNTEAVAGRDVRRRARYYSRPTGRFLAVDPAGGNTFDPASLHPTSTRTTTR